METPILQDAHGRRIRNLRISVTDRCNFRCIYCMPKDPHWMPHENIMTFEEIVRFARIAISVGIEKIRLTGGEPTARKDFPKLVAMIAPLEGLRDLSMTTNGMLLTKLAGPLWDAGLRRLNISLDTLKEEKFVHIARRDAERSGAPLPVRGRQGGHRHHRERLRALLFRLRPHPHHGGRADPDMPLFARRDRRPLDDAGRGGGRGDRAERGDRKSVV